MVRVIARPASHLNRHYCREDIKTTKAIPKGGGGGDLRQKDLDKWPFPRSQYELVRQRNQRSYPAGGEDRTKRTGEGVGLGVEKRASKSTNELSYSY